MSIQNSLLKDRLKQTKESDIQIMNRTFGQGADTVSQHDQEHDWERSISSSVKDKINQIFKERILTDRKDENFKILMRDTIAKLLEQEPKLMNDMERRKSLTHKILDEILGFGPIQNLIEDPDVTEIMVSRWDKIYVERGGRLALEPSIMFDSDEQLRDVIAKIVQPIGRKIDESVPLVDARLPDGSRVNATVPPISPDGCTLTIRKFSKKKLTGEDYLKFGSLDEKVLEFLRLCVEGRINIIVSGGTGSGKTTLLNMLSNFIPPWESIVTVEDSCELQLYQDNVRRLEARPPNAEGKGEITIRDLVKNTLRMRPDRIVVGEIRDGCVVDMFRAMSSGHDGSLTTIHANNPRDLMDATLPILFGMSDMKFTERAQKQQIVSAVDLIVQIARMRDGSRKLVNVTEVVGLGAEGASKLKIKNVEDEKIYLQDIFRYRQTGFNADGKLQGYFECTGYQPKAIVSKLESMGIDIPTGLFDKTDQKE
jgi:pilus assembly protein CpaF